MAHATFADVTGSVLVDLWEDQIALVQPGNVYRITKLQVCIWGTEKKLTSTRESVFTSIANNDLQSVHVSQDDVQSDLIKTMVVSTRGNFVLDQSAHLFTFWPLSQSECVNREFCKHT